MNWYMSFARCLISEPFLTCIISKMTYFDRSGFVYEGRKLRHRRQFVMYSHQY